MYIERQNGRWKWRVCKVFFFSLSLFSITVDNNNNDNDSLADDTQNCVWWFFCFCAEENLSLSLFMLIAFFFFAFQFQQMCRSHPLIVCEHERNFFFLRKILMTFKLFFFSLSNLPVVISNYISSEKLLLCNNILLEFFFKLANEANIDTSCTREIYFFLLYFILVVKNNLAIF